MLPLPLELEQLYDGQGRHIGGVMPPLLIGNNELSAAYRQHTAARPYTQHLGVSEASDNLGLVWMLPHGPNPLATSPAVLGALVQTLDAGQGLVMHGSDVVELLQAAELVRRMVGGGHA